MSSKPKDRVFSSTKITSLNPSKTLISSSHKPNSHHKIPIVPSTKKDFSSVKENPRPISAGRSSSIARLSVVSGAKENPRPISAGRASVTRAENLSLKQGKFTDFRSDFVSRVSGTKERRSFAGFSGLDKDLLVKGLQGKNSSGKFEKSLNAVEENLEYRRSNELLGLKSVRSVHKVVDAKMQKVGRKAVAGSENSRLKNVCCSKVRAVEGKVGNRTGVLDNFADGVVLIDAKKSEEICQNGILESDMKEMDQVKGVLTVDLKAFDGKSTCERDNTKDCLDLHSAVNAYGSSQVDNPKAESGNAFLLDVHSIGESDQLGFESVRPEENFGVEVKYQSKLHEKLALLEGKVQKIAMEIKQTKEMLNKNKPRESKLVLSDIQKKICGVEKSVHSLKDGAKSELASSEAGKVCSIQNRDVVSNTTVLVRNSMSALNSYKQTIPMLNGEPKVYSGLTNEKPIAVEILTDLNAKKSKAENFDANVELNHGVVSKMQLDRTSSVQCDLTSLIGARLVEVSMESNEKLKEFDVIENNFPLGECVGSEEPSSNRLYEIGRKISTGGWFVSEGDAILLAHDDNSCSYYDIANNEVKSEYSPPPGLSRNLWGDCWLIRAPGADGCSGRYIVAASAGNALDSGFCSWDFYTKDIKAFRAVGETKNSFMGSLSSTSTRTSSQTSSLFENQSCWYRPCGPLLLSTCSRQKIINAYDIRDGDLIMAWEAQSPVSEMEFSSPLQWRSRDKVVIAERETITLWDVNSLNPQPVLSVPCIGKKIYSLHVNNTDAEIGAGVRQRASSSEVEGNDGVFSTEDSINVLDFRIPTGAGLKISRRGANALSIFSLKDSIFIGSTDARSSTRSKVEHFSLRKGKLMTTYLMPEFNSHTHHSSVTQVWGNSYLVMGICGMGMFVFDAYKDEGLLSSSSSSSVCKESRNQVKEAIGGDSLYRPTFDYMESRALIISRNRSAFWRYLS